MEETGQVSMIDSNMQEFVLFDEKFQTDRDMMRSPISSTESLARMEDDERERKSLDDKVRANTWLDGSCSEGSLCFQFMHMYICISIHVYYCALVSMDRKVDAI